MNTTFLSKLFPLGETVITANALGRVYPADVCMAIMRHACGDWGELSAADEAENALSLKEGYRLLSAYSDRNGIKFWIITEGDRSVTTVLLPEDY